MKFTLIVALLGSLAALASTKKCSELPTNLMHDAIQFCQPYIFNLYESSHKTDQCIQLYYFGNRGGASNKATAIFATENDAANFPYSVTVSPNNNMWEAVGDNPADKFQYYKLFVNDKEHYFCLYACDDQKEFIKSLRCFAIDEKGHTKIADELKNMPDLPFAEGSDKYMPVYNCDKNKRVGGYRLASGSADKKTCSFSFADLFNF